MQTLPAPPSARTSDSARGLGIASIVTGIVGLLILPIVFGPIALILGIIAVNQHFRAAWWGIVLGSVQLAIVAYAMFQLSEALSSL
jgi:hypothetical protein